MLEARRVCRVDGLQDLACTAHGVRRRGELGTFSQTTWSPLINRGILFKQTEPLLRVTEESAYLCQEGEETVISGLCVGVGHRQFPVGGKAISIRT